MGKFDKISEETIHKNPWWKYKHDKYELPNGEKGDYYYQDIEPCVVVVPVLPNGNIIVINQYRYLLQQKVLSFPAGYSEGKNLKQIAKEETQEETGYECNSVKKTGKFYRSPGTTKDKFYSFVAKVGEQKEQNLDTEEEIEVLEKTPQGLQNLVNNGEMTVGSAITAWTLSLNYLVGEVDNFSSNL
jgi:ADP-ribose pyrophosphatase